MSKKKKIKTEKKKNESKQEVKKAGMGGVLGGAALAGAGSLLYDHTTGQQFAQFETADGNIVTVWADTDNNGVYDTEFSRVTPIPENEQVVNEEVVQADTVPLNEDGQSFGEAFADARQELGPGGVFEWNGHMYNTFYVEELNDMTPEQLSEWSSLPDDEKIDYYNNVVEDMDDDDIDNVVSNDNDHSNDDHSDDNQDTHNIHDDDNDDGMDDNDMDDNDQEEDDNGMNDDIDDDMDDIDNQIGMEDIDNDEDMSDWEIV